MFIPPKSHAFRLICFVLAVFWGNVFTAQAQTERQARNIYSGLNNATSVYVTQTHVFVVEQGTHQLLKLNLNGAELERIGGNGSGDYQFSRPFDVDATNGLKIYISDYNNGRVQIFDRRGQFLGSYVAGNNFSQRRFAPTQLVVNNLGEVFFYNERDNSVQHFNLSGIHANSYNLPRDISTVDDMVLVDEFIFVLDKKTETIFQLSQNWMIESFYPAEGVEAFHKNEQLLALVYANNIELRYPSHIRELKWEAAEPAIDAHLSGNFLFVLTAQNLYRISLLE